MICEQCNKENRGNAKFCKWCGQPLVSQYVLDKLIGLEDVKAQLKNIVDTYAYLRSRKDIATVRLSVNAIIIGETGTGKTALAEIIRDYFFQHRIIEKPKLTMVDAVDYQRFVDKWEDNIKKARNGILFFDNVQKLLPDKYSNQVNPLDKLFVEMDKWDDNPIVIMAGLPKGLDDFLENNPAVKNRFKYIFRLPVPGYQQLCDIVKQKLSRKYGLSEFSPEADDQLTRYFKYQIKIKDETFGNAHLAMKTAEDIFTLFISRGSAETRVERADIKGYVPEERSLDDILGDMDTFIGMTDVKHAVREMAYSVQNGLQRQKRGLGEAQKMSMHTVLTGNPGTGKTSLSRKMGEVLQSMDILPTSRVLEVSRATLIGKYMGETPKIVNSMCDKAMGGILFIDEAYTLSDGGDQYGKEAIDTLMKRMEDDRGKFVVIAAGYKDKMEEFLQMNPGLASRFTHKLHIDDYNEDELLSIFKSMAQKEQYTLSQTAEFKLLDTIYKMVLAKDESWGNAREMRNLLDSTIQKLSVRVSQMPPDQVTKETYQIILPEDI